MCQMHQQRAIHPASRRGVTLLPWHRELSDPTRVLQGLGFR